MVSLKCVTIVFFSVKSRFVNSTVSAPGSCCTPGKNKAFSSPWERSSLEIDSPSFMDIGGKGLITGPWVTEGRGAPCLWHFSMRSSPTKFTLKLHSQVTKQKSPYTLGKLTLPYRDAFTAILSCMWPAGCGLNSHRTLAHQPGSCIPFSHLSHRCYTACS